MEDIIAQCYLSHQKILTNDVRLLKNDVRLLTSRLRYALLFGREIKAYQVNQH